MRLAKAVVIGALASFALACSGPGGITIPSIPPIPSFNIPSFPPIVLPSSGETLPPGVIPSSSGTCAFISPEEISSAMGATATLTDASNGDCTFTFSNFSSVNISTENSTDLQAAHFLFGATAKDITVGGLAAVSGIFIGQPAVYVQKGANQMQVLGILTGSDDATVAKLIQIATLTVSRWPG